MNLNISIKKVICFLLAVLMLLSTVACKDTGKKKVIKKIKKKVIIVNDEPTEDNSSIIEEEEEEEEEKEVIRPKRKLPEVAKEKYVEPIIPEFDYEYKALNITNDYVIVYSFEKWKDRYESKNRDGSKRAISETAFCKIAANDLKVYFNETYGLELEVVRDDNDKAKNATKKILVGDTQYYKTKLAENEFAVKIDGENLVFEGGHFTMVEKAVDWFQTVEKKAGHVATLSGKKDDFKSTITLNGVKYDYVWGDEFDGEEFNDNDKWEQGEFGLERQDDMVNIFNDTRFQYVENGRLRLTGDRYYDEGNALIGYATSGQIGTDGTMLFRNGYFEFRARLPYTRGGFPAIWTMTADPIGQQNLPNFYYDDGCGVYSERLWNLEFDLFESFADTDHMTTTIHKWYTDSYKQKSTEDESFDPSSQDVGKTIGLTNISKIAQDLTLQEEMMVAKDIRATKAKKTQWTYDAPLVKTDNEDNDPTKGNKLYTYLYYTNKDGKTVYVTYNNILDQNDLIAAGRYKLANGETSLQEKFDKGIIKQGEYINTKDVTAQTTEIEEKMSANPDYKVPQKDVIVIGTDKNGKFGEQKIKIDDTLQAMIDNDMLVQPHVRHKIEMKVKQKDKSFKIVDMFEYRLSPFTNMSKSMNTYAYSFTYKGSKGVEESIWREDKDGIYSDWRWYFDEETINNEYHIYAFHVTSDHCTVYMDGKMFLDFDWDPAYDYKDLDGDGKGDDISNNNNGVGFNFWQYFIIDMMIYTPGNFKIDDYRKLQAGDVPLNLYIDYVRCYQDLDDDTQALYYPNGEAK